MSMAFKRCQVDLTARDHRPFNIIEFESCGPDIPMAFARASPTHIIVNLTTRGGILVQVTINRRLLIGRDGHLDQSEAYDLS